MLKKALLALCFLGIVSAAVYYFLGYDDTNMPLDAASANATIATLKQSEENISPEDVENAALGLALKTIILSQGEGGSTLWRLKASAGSMGKDKGVIKVEKPKLVYYMPPDDAELSIISQFGDIDQDNKLLRFVGKVNATHKKGAMLGELLVYNGTTKTMSFPHGGQFFDETVNGTAREFVWHVDTKVIEGIGDVDATFIPQTKKPIADEADPDVKGNSL